MSLIGELKTKKQVWWQIKYYIQESFDVESTFMTKTHGHGTFRKLQNLVYPFLSSRPWCYKSPEEQWTGSTQVETLETAAPNNKSKLQQGHKPQRGDVGGGGNKLHHFVCAFNWTVAEQEARSENNFPFKFKVDARRSPMAFWASFQAEWGSTTDYFFVSKKQHKQELIWIWSGTRLNDWVFSLVHGRVTHG